MSDVEVWECPTCGLNETEKHPMRDDVTRCANCKEWKPRG